MNTHNRLAGGGYSRDEYHRFALTRDRDEMDAEEEDTVLVKKQRTEDAASSWNGSLYSGPPMAMAAPPHPVPCFPPESRWYVVRLEGIAYCAAAQVCTNRHSRPVAWNQYAHFPKGACLQQQSLSFAYRRMHSSGMVQWWYFCPSKACMYHLYNHPQLHGVKFTGDRLLLYGRTVLTNDEELALVAHGYTIAPRHH